MSVAVKANKLTKRYKDVVAVDALELEINKGELFALLGVNGAGKTTAIKMLSCLASPTEGDGEIMGLSITERPNDVKAVINVSPQETAVAPNLTVFENLAFIAQIYGFSRVEAEKKAEGMIGEFNLASVRDRRAKTLSGGYARRLSIAMALITEPKVLFLDEPTLGLDVLSRRELWRSITALKGKITVVLTTHYLEEAEALSDRLAIMAGGKLLAVGRADQIKRLANTDSFEEAFVRIVAGEVKGTASDRVEGVQR